MLAFQTGQRQAIPYTAKPEPWACWSAGDRRDRREGDQDRRKANISDKAF